MQRNEVENLEQTSRPLLRQQNVFEVPKFEITEVIVEGKGTLQD